MAFNGGLITEESISLFILELDNLIMEIFDISIPFQEKVLTLESQRRRGVSTRRI